MKLKILIVPFLSVAMIIFIIWFLVPSFFDLRTETGKLQAANAKVTDMQEKIQRAGGLKRDLQTNTEQQKILLSYLPAGKQEENIIGDIDSITYNEGVALSGVVVAKDLAATDAAVPTDPAALSPDGITPAVAAPVTAKTVEVSFKLAGSYEKIRNILVKMANLKRYNDLTEVKIAKVSVTSPTGAEQSGNAANQNNLAVDVKAKFKYLEKIKSVASVDNNVLKTGKFNMDVIDEIRSSKTTQEATLNFGTPGRSNPFTL